MQRNRTGNWKDVLSIDFSAEFQRKDEMKQVLLQQVRQKDAVKLTEKEDTMMHQTNKKHVRHSSAAALAACLIMALTLTAFAAANYFSLGRYANYVVDSGEGMGDATQMEESVSEELQYVTTEKKEQSRDQITTLFVNSEVAQTYLAFNIRLFTYIPSGYTLEGYRIYNDENGQPEQDTKYLELNFYKEGDINDYIYVQARYMDEETGFTSSGSGDIEKMTINGYEAILNGSHKVDILIDDVIYMISGRNLAQNEVIKMAESLTK